MDSRAIPPSPNVLTWSSDLPSDTNRLNWYADQFQISTKAFKNNQHVLVWHHDPNFAIIHASDADILGGRGKHLDLHPGNVRLNQLVDMFTIEHQHGTLPQSRSEMSLRSLSTH